MCPPATSELSLPTRPGGASAAKHGMRSCGSQHAARAFTLMVKVAILLELRES